MNSIFDVFIMLFELQNFTVHLLRACQFTQPMPLAEHSGNTNYRQLPANYRQLQTTDE